MQSFVLSDEKEFDSTRHVEKILDTIAGGDVTVACWEPGQTSPNHCHPEATEIYFCFEGRGIMNSTNRSVDVVPGTFVVHPPGELHEFINGGARTLLFRVRYGTDMASRTKEWPSNSDWQPSEADRAYFASA